MVAGFFKSSNRTQFELGKRSIRFLKTATESVDLLPSLAKDPLVVGKTNEKVT